jgi:hypothetical protein
MAVRPSFWSMYSATRKILSTNATGSRTIFTGWCFHRQRLPAPGLAPPCPFLLFALLYLHVFI